MARYLLARLGGMLLVMSIVAVLVFVLTRAAPGDPIAVLLGDQATAEDIARVQKVYGLDRPLPVQFALWLRELAHGNLGESIFLQRPVTQALWERAEPTALLSLMAIAIAALIGVPCGIVSAVYRGQFVDQAFTGFAMLGASVPSFWFGLVLMQIFAVGLGWFPVSGYGEPGASLAARLHTLVLPATVLGVLNSALIIRFTRASMLDVLGEDYVRTARAKGLRRADDRAQARAAQRAGADRHGARPDRRADDRRRGRHRNGVRPARRRQPGGQRGDPARLPGDPGRAAGGGGDLRADQLRHRPALHRGRSAREGLMK